MSSQWIVEFHKQLVRGKQVLLYGNVGDLVLLNGGYLSLHQFLEQYFSDEGYEIVGRYDIVDGIRFADQEMQQLFQRTVTQSKGGDAEAGAANVPPPMQSSQQASPGQQTGSNQPTTESAQTNAAGEGNRPRRSMPRARSRTRRGPMLVQPDQALDAIRTVLSQSEVSSAVCVDFSDKLVTDPQRQTENELKLMVQVKKIIQEAAYLVTDPLKGRKNVLAVVAGHLGSLPPWLYHENPLIGLVQVTQPRLDERKNFIRVYLPHFQGGNSLGGEQTEEIVRDFSDLTDGLTAWDLEAIRRTSIVEDMSIAKPRRVVDYYKYGQRDDPWEKLDEQKIRHACHQLEQRVIGQPAAIKAVVDMLLAARVGVSMSEVTAGAGKPKGVFFFVGPTGVGKTEMAKAITQLVFGDDAAFERFDMSEFAEQHAAEKLTGSPPGYVGFEEGGRLTNRVRERPFSLLLFDEIEKAHGRVMDKFLQILEDGRLTDGKGQTAYFSQTVIIFTSNIGSDTLDLHGSASGETVISFDEVRMHYRDRVREHFTRELGRPELLNRLGDNILVFDVLRPEYIKGICKKFLRMLAASAMEKCHLELVFPDDGVVQMIGRLMLAGDNMLFGGRRIKTLLEAMVERPLNRWIFFEKPASGSRLETTVDDSGFEILVNGKPISDIE